ncbi:hypothetical protein HK19_15345 [Acetobacter persici]|uniref:Uncharacterized protein n=3 Tax=Acetobacter TaxID=434 RepID=A0A149UM75_9PROT|nr:hypothetical protein AD951_08300 [Acetobacter malorum]OUI89023.1 hypothetical protein HK19_15345 [Acetobacter persici]
MTFLVAGDLDHDMEEVLRLIKSHGIALTQSDLVRLGLSVAVKVLLPELQKPAKNKHLHTQADIEALLLKQMK